MPLDGTKNALKYVNLSSTTTKNDFVLQKLEQSHLSITHATKESSTTQNNFQNSI